MTPPRVSVVIPAFNAGHVIEAALTSVAWQTLRDLEVVLVDDASRDDTVARARACLEGYRLRHTILEMEANAGPAMTRNRGVVVAQGEYVAFLDADDEWLPGKLESQIRLMEANPSVTLCGCQALWIDEHDRVVEPLFKRLPTLLPDGWKRLLWHCYVATPCAMVRRDDLGICPFDPRLRIGEDRDLWIKLASNGVVGLVQDVMVRIRLSPSSFMPRNRDLIEQHTKPMLRRHLDAFSDLLSWRDHARAIGCLDRQIGKTLCQNPGTYRRGAQFLLMAMLLGFRPIDSMRELLYTAPILRRPKAFLKQRLLQSGG